MASFVLLPIGGTSRTAQTSHTGEEINNIFFIDANTGWAVTDNGDIQKTIIGSPLLKLPTPVALPGRKKQAALLII